MPPILRYPLFLLATVFAAAAPPPPPPSPLVGSTLPEAGALMSALAEDGYRFTPAVRAAFLAFAKANALAELERSGRSVPADFLAWIDADPEVAATVYGSRFRACDVLAVLRSLEIDLGPESVRDRYTQIALAMAVARANLGPQADLAPRERLRLVIPGDPRRPVDTKDPERPRDLHDHIINFLESNEIEEDVVVGHREEPAELKYDDKGVALPAPKGKPKKVAVTEKRRRALVAADVFASRDLQEKLNAYLAANGQSVRVDCGDRIIWPNRKEAVGGPEAKGILDAYRLFRAAYEAKGRLPAARDPSPTPSEACAYLIRNHEHVFPDAVRAQRNWPRFPLDAPWPLLTLLAQDNQPLREREEIWARFRDRGETRTYGEYIGPIAQQFDFQSARRLAPFPFAYGTYQMMAKDGGVCGAMANMGARTYIVLGIPSCTAGQPGHCALIHFAFDPKTGIYQCKGGQYATAGDEATQPHGRWVFGDVDAGRAMVYHQSIAWAVNAGFAPFLDATLAHTLFRMLPEPAREAHGPALLQSGLAFNPFHILLAEALQETAHTPQAQIAAWESLRSMLAASAKPGCPPDGLYANHLKARTFAKLGKLPPPADRTEAGRILDFLLRENCDLPAAVAAYRLAIDGLPSLLARTEADFTAHLAARTRANRADDTACTRMAATLKAAGESIPDKKMRADWAARLLDSARGQEKYFGHRLRVATDASFPALAKLAGRKLPPETELLGPFLDRLAAELAASVAAPRDPAKCRALAARLSAAAKAVSDPAQKERWSETLAGTMRGNEEIPPADPNKKNARPSRDPCADAIAALRPPEPPPGEVTPKG